MKLVHRALRGALVVSLAAGGAVPLATSSAHAVAPSGTTTLVSPAMDEIVGGNPTFTWTAVPGAAKYRVQVSTSDLFDPVVYTADTVNTSATPANALPVGLLYWRVAPTDGGSGVGAFTGGYFTREWAAAPNVTGPPDTQPLTYPHDPLLFTWEPLEGAQRYNVQVDDEPNFISPLVSTATVNTSYTLTDPQTNDTEFYWRVQGVSGNVVSPWSAPRSYSVKWPEKPVLLYPAVGQSVTDVVLRWSPVAGASAYQLQVSQNEDFSNNMAVDVRVKGTSYSPPADDSLAAASYFWRVRAVDAKQGTVQNLGAWTYLMTAGPLSTAPAQFTRVWPQRPTAVSPPNGARNVENPTFKWTAVPYASHYELQISYDQNFSPLETKKCYTNNTSFTAYTQVSGSTPPVPGNCEIIETYLRLNQVVYWRVRGIDAPTNILGQFSDPSEFLFRHTQVAPLSPLSGSEVAVPTLKWSPIGGVAKYRLTITRTDTGTQEMVDTYATSYTPTGLVAGKSYSWYVVSVDDMNRVGAAPMAQYVWTFTYASVTGTEAATTILTPLDAEGAPIWPSFSWTPVQNATKYKIWYGEIGSTLLTFLGETSTTAYTPASLPPAAKPYIWRVDAHNVSGTVIDESPISTFAIQDLPLVTGMLPEKCTPDSVCVNIAETPQLTWAPTLYTGTYHVWIANDPDFTNIVRTYRTVFPSLTIREALKDSVAGQAYYWFVQPCRNGLTRCGKADHTTFPTASAFRKRSLPVQLVSPADGAVVPAAGSTDVEVVTFSWDEYAGTNAAAVPPTGQGAKTYRVQVSTVNDFATILDQIDVDQTTYTAYTKTYPEGPLYWRVAALDGSDNVLTYSPQRTVIKASPPLATTFPDPGSVVSGTPYFKWTAQPHVKEYELEVYKGGDSLFSPSNKVALGASAITLTRMTAFTPTKSLPVGDYAWRVRRKDADGLNGPWTDGGVFTVGSQAPTLLSPAPDTVFTGNSMLFTWTGVTGAAKYKFESSMSAGFATLVENVTTVMTSWAPVVKYGDGTVWWRVKVLDGDNHVVAVSEPSSIVKDGTAPTVVTKTPTSNALVSNGAFTVTFSEKVKNVSTSTFVMKVAASGTPVAGTVTPGVTTETTTATFKPSGPLLPGESYTVSLSPGITDLNGNPLVPASWQVRTELNVDSGSPAVLQYWDRDTSTSASGGGFLASRTAGARVRYSFDGTSASILGKRAPDGGYGEVWVDGVKAATVSFYSSSTKYKQLIWSKTGLAAKTHTVELRVLGTKPSSASSSWVYPDAFRYGATTLEETSTKVVQSHRSVALSGAFGKSYQLATHTASGDNGTQPYVVLRFKGTGVSWKGIRSYSGGIAKVYLDNTYRSSVDQYGSPSTSGQTLWSVSGLTNGVHTLKIVLTGTKRSTSKGYNVTFDSFGVV